MNGLCNLGGGIRRFLKFLKFFEARKIKKDKKRGYYKIIRCLLIN